MTNTNVVLDKSHILAFIVKPTNGFTEHYVSSQPLSLLIPYTEYVRLIKELVELNLDILRTSISVYKRALINGETSVAMLKLYHYDIALSGLEELYKSSRRGFECTRIFGSVDCYCGLDVKAVRFESSAEFIQNHFTQNERHELHQLMGSLKNIPENVLTGKGEHISNTYMYYLCMGFFGVFKFQKNFIINVKEE